MVRMRCIPVVYATKSVCQAICLHIHDLSDSVKTVIVHAVNNKPTFVECTRIKSELYDTVLTEK